MFKAPPVIGLCAVLMLASGTIASVRVAGATPGVRIVAMPMPPVNVRDLARSERVPGYREPARTSIAALPRGTAPSLRFPSARPPTLLAAGPRVTVAAPGFGERTPFLGMADSANGSTGPVIEPPDPWVAVGPSHIVQAVNKRLRFSSRQGTTLSEVSLATFFSEPGDQLVNGDSRVLYDAAHGRWLASELSADCSTGHLRLAISDGADPTMGWNSWDFAFPGVLPDYPGLGFSSDKVALSSNAYPWSACMPGTFQSADVAAFDWSDLLDAGGLTGSNFSSASLFTWRPAQNLTPSSTLRLVAEQASGDVLYGAITGTNLGADIVLNTTDLSSVVPPFAVPPQPLDPSGPIDAAVDQRPTDALWQNGHLWFVSTYPYQVDAGLAYRDTVRVTELATTSATPTKTQDFLIGSSGLDTFMGGIGLSQTGSLFVVYSLSGPSSYVSLQTAFQSTTATPDSITAYRLLRSGLAGYRGSRWGDYVGVATDPVNAHAVWQAGEYANSVGSWSTRVSMLTEDLTPPGLASRSPLPNAVNVSLSPTVTAHFSEPVTGVSTTSMAISNVANLVNLSATVSYNAGTRTATLHPSSPLALGATYRVAMSGRIADLSSNPLGWTTWNFTTGAPVTVKQGTSTGYQFNSSGAVTATKTFTLGANSGAFASKRQAITNQSGMWLAISSGIWNGYWVRESSAVYLSASPIPVPPGANATFSPARSLSFLRGTHTGYQFNTAGAMTAQKTFTLGANSTALTTQRSTIAKQFGTWFRVSSGVWAGYWLRSSDVVFLSP